MSFNGFFQFFDKKSAGSDFKSMPNQQQLADELHKPITRKFKEREVYFSLKTIFGVLIWWICN